MQKYGQHFLINENVINQIIDAALLLKSENLVEIGPGKALSGFVKKTAKAAGVEAEKLHLFHMETEEELQAFLSWYHSSRQ